MPSRTYIQMWLKLYNMGKYHVPICEETAELLMKYDYILGRYPVIVEHVVQQRVACFKYCKLVGCKNIPEFMLVIYEKHIIDIYYAKMVKERKYDIEFVKGLVKWLKEDSNKN